MSTPADRPVSGDLIQFYGLNNAWQPEVMWGLIITVKDSQNLHIDGALITILHPARMGLATYAFSSCTWRNVPGEAITYIPWTENVS